MITVVFLISGNGSNLQAMLDAVKNGLAINIAAVISNQPDAYGLQRASDAGIPAHVINHRQFDSRDDFDLTLQQQIDAYQPNLIVLAGFMRRLGSEFVAHYLGKMINIHPSLLPKYPGLDTHKRALEAGDRQHGASIHFVTDDLDAGPVIGQTTLEIQAEDTEESLKSRVQALEHQLYPEVLGWFAENRIALKDGQVYLDGKPISHIYR